MSDTQNGSLINQLLVAVFGFVGILYLPTAWPKLRKYRRTWLSLSVLYCVWCLLTLIWSADQGLSVRRYISYLFLFFGSVGIGAGFYGRTPQTRELLWRHVTIAGVLSCFTAAAVSYEGLSLANLVNPAWTPLARSIGGPFLIYPLTLALIAATYGLVSSKSRRRQWWLVLAATLIFASLVLLKSRSMIIYTLAVAALVYFIISKQRFWLYGFGLIVAFLLLFIVDDSGSLGNTANSFFLRGEHTSTYDNLSGRVPLWTYLLGEAQRHLLQGEGFGAFWREENMRIIWSVVHWEAVVGHNGYIDELLNTGAIGLCLYLACWLNALYFTWRRIRTDTQDKYAVLVFGWIVVYLCVNTFDSLAQTYFKFPFYVTVIGFAAIGPSSRQAVRIRNQL